MKTLPPLCPVRHPFLDDANTVAEGIILSLIQTSLALEDIGGRIHPPATVSRRDEVRFPWATPI